MTMSTFDKMIGDLRYAIEDLKKARGISTARLPPAKPGN